MVYITHSYKTKDLRVRDFYLKKVIDLEFIRLFFRRFMN